MKNFNDLRNAINARIDAIQKSLTQKESEQIIIQEIVYAHKNKIRNRSFIREILEKKLEVVDAALRILTGADVSLLDERQHALLLKGYHEHLDLITAEYYEDAISYLKRFKHLVDNGAEVEITKEIRERILLSIKTELERLKNVYMNFNLSSNIPELEACKVNIKEDITNEIADQSLLGDNWGELSHSYGEIGGIMMYLSEQAKAWEEIGKKLYDSYNDSLAGICQRLDTQALNNWLARFEVQYHSNLLNQELSLEQGQSPLTFCCAQPTPVDDGPQITFVDALLQHGAKINEVDNLGHTALDRATYCHNIKLMTYLLQHSEANVDILGGYNRTPLHIAAFVGFSAGITLLLQLGANPNAQTMNENPGGLLTPVHNAILRADLACVTALLADQRTDFYLPESEGYGSLAYAMACGVKSFSIVEYLLEKGITLRRDQPLNQEDAITLAALAKKYYVTKDKNPEAFVKLSQLINKHCQPEINHMPTAGTSAGMRNQVVHLAPTGAQQVNLNQQVVLSNINVIKK